MRPRPDAAENRDAESLSVALQGASMRPRPDAAENDIKAVIKVHRGELLQ